MKQLSSKNHRASKKWRLIPLTALLVFVTTLGAPWFLQSGAAADSVSNLELFQRGLESGFTPNGDRTYPTTINHATCKGIFRDPIVKTTNLLKRHISEDVSNIRNWPNPSRQDVVEWMGSDGVVRTRIGNFSASNQSDMDTLMFLFAGVGEALIPMLDFQPTDELNKPSDNRDDGQTFPDSSGVCSGNSAIPINQTRGEWRGLQSTALQQAGEPVSEYMTFELDGYPGNNAVGFMTLESYQGPPTSRGWEPRSRQIEVYGKPDFNRSGGAETGTIVASWVDASTITIPDSSSAGLYGGDVYVKRIWGNDADDGKAYYFLETAGDSSRGAITWNSGLGCEQPQPVGAPCKPSGELNCVPFIEVSQLLDVSRNDTNLERLQNDINQLGRSQATLYDYDTSASTCVVRSKLQIPYFRNVTNAKIWLFYDAGSDTFQPIWAKGSGNEAPYLGIYSISAGAYQGGAFDCNGRISIDSIPDDPGDGSDPIYDVRWTLLDNSCQTIYGTLTVSAIGGQAGEAGPIISPDPDPETGPNEDPRIGCDFFTGNPLNWIVCPFINAATGLVSGLDSLINSMLDIGVARIFDDRTDTGAAYRAAWGVFRTFALVAMVIAALVMVISQALGLDFLDAYTVRKVLPRFLVAAAGITLSWEIMEVAVTASNDLGHAVRDIIYSPFSRGEFSNFGQLSGGTNFVLLLLSTGVALAYGWVGLLTIAITAVLASIIAFALLVFRELLIIFLVMIAPLAIAASILPNTQKVWKIWFTTFWSLLIVFVIISAFIATGRVFSLTSSTGGVVAQLISIVAWFAPYFLIPLAFRLAGGVVSSIGGFVNDRSRGLFDSLKNARANIARSRRARFKEGGLFDENRRFTGRLAKGVNRVGLGVSAAQGRGGWRQLLAPNSAEAAAQRAGAAFMRADQYGQMYPRFKAFADDEDATYAHASHDNRELLAQTEWFAKKDEYGNALKNADGSYLANTERIDGAIARSKAMGYSTVQSRFAASDALGLSGKGPATPEEAKRLARAVAGNNSSLYQAALGNLQWRQRSTGGFSAGRDTRWASLREMDLQTMGSQKPHSIKQLMASAGKLLEQGKTMTTEEIEFAAQEFSQEGKGEYSVEQAQQRLVKEGKLRDLTQEERQQISDRVYAAEDSPYTNAYTQLEVKNAKRFISPEMEKESRRRQLAKVGMDRGPDGSRLPAPPPGSQVGPRPMNGPEDDNDAHPGNYL